ncbi:hypothetical protein O3M35_004316 [Rhynocoris fuscipes]|uniref:Molybdopterin synthase catalytic subunit n=1 Tax=Rhynocoris fuscipes TaxID=488301 RepID=A0AAW1CJG5_9HEMI
MDFLNIGHEVLSVDKLVEKVKAPNCGAVSVFIGTTRNNFNQLEVSTLYYEAYEQMALKSLKEICAEVRAKWPAIENIAISHRLGEVGVGEMSVILAISSPHRSDSIAAISFTMDQLKSKVPIWKKEVYCSADKAEWKENKECKWASSQ